MGENANDIENLLQRLEFLLKKQESSLREFYILKSELLKLKKEQQPKPPDAASLILEPAVEETNITEIVAGDLETVVNEPGEREVPEHPNFEEKLRSSVQSKKSKSDVERFIGENLISKIGIAITVIGVSIGAKYAIDHQLISPLTRILLGYLVGLGLFGFSIRLKKEYENFSAVLLSGAMAIFYFITFAAYNFYDLIPQLMAFGLMLLFTGFTVRASLRYNRQVIALYGMVGAYAIPFLLSNNTGQITTLFLYITIINAGILILSAKKYWHALYYSAFVLTWLIYAGWFEQRYNGDDFGTGIGFLSLFFLMFYVTFLSYKLIRKEQFGINDVFLLLANTFIFYGYGYVMIEDQPDFDHLLGGFTLCNALIHFSVAFILIRKKLADKNLIAFISGLVFVFITISIPVQLDGNWVTLLWVLQAALLFWIGRTKGATIYEKLSYPLMVLACISLVHDWFMGNNYDPTDPESRVLVFLNVQFLTSLIFIGAFAFINHINQKKQYISALFNQRGWDRIVYIGLPTVLLMVIFFSFRVEIIIYWEQLFLDSGTVFVKGEAVYSYTNQNTDILKWQTLSLINFSTLYFGTLLLVNVKKIKHDVMGVTTVLLSLATVFVFLTQGLFELSELRESYLDPSPSSFLFFGSMNLWIRYLCIGLIGGLLGMIWRQLMEPYIKLNLKIPFEIFFHISMVWILSSELINWMEIMDVDQTYKIGLSILWGLYSLGMVAFGIWKRKKYLRIGAIVLFGVTLIKLFVYDLSSLDTIEKTIAFVSLGVLLLIISFLYNKYKSAMLTEGEE